MSTMQSCLQVIPKRCVIASLLILLMSVPLVEVFACEKHSPATANVQSSFLRVGWQRNPIPCPQRGPFGHFANRLQAAGPVRSFISHRGIGCPPIERGRVLVPWTAWGSMGQSSFHLSGGPGEFTTHMSPSPAVATGKDLGTNHLIQSSG